jgi:hypothetical protein
MKNILTILFLIITIHCYGQDKTMIIDFEYRGYSSYGNNNLIKIDSLSELPSVIQFNTSGHLKRLLGSMRDSLQFSHGQENDLKGIFKKDSITFYGDLIKAKYILNYKLVDNTIGIKNYCLSLDLDEYGQLLAVNWPRKRYNDKSKFLPREKIKLFALEQAKLRGFDTSAYIVYAQYNRTLGKLLWLFKFPNHPILESSNILEIDWKALEVVREYRVDDNLFK